MALSGVHVNENPQLVFTDTLHLDSTFPKLSKSTLFNLIS
nr:MAG TPA: hypothetical protein [Caudoviricetes sp.]